MNSICVFCGSSPGNDPAYAEAARLLGRTLAGRNVTLVYGGGHVGLMGVVAAAAATYMPASVRVPMPARGAASLQVTSSNTPTHKRPRLVVEDTRQKRWPRASRHPNC